MATARSGSSTSTSQTRVHHASQSGTATYVQLNALGNQHINSGVTMNSQAVPSVHSSPTGSVTAITATGGQATSRSSSVSTISSISAQSSASQVLPASVTGASPPSASVSTQPQPALASSPPPPQIQPFQVQPTGNNAITATHSNHPVLLKQKLRRTISQWNDWWFLEVTAGASSIACLVTIISILAHYDDKPLNEWHSRITPNAIISVLATVSKSSLLMPVAECISQLTWLRFQRPHSLQLIQEFDEASRGALGSFQILFSTEAVAAWTGAIITLTALAFEPFVQQVLLLKSREVLLQESSATVPVYTVFNTGKTRSVSFPYNYYPLGDDAHSLDPSIRAAGFDGIYSTNITSPYTCRAPTCRFPAFSSLAMCSSCTDVLKELNNNCNGTLCTYTTPANISIQARYNSGATSKVVFATLFNSSAQNSNRLDMPTVAKFATLKMNLTTSSYGRELVPLGAYDCSLRLCLKSWAWASFQASSYAEPAPTELDFQKVTPRKSGELPLSTLETDPVVNASRFGTYKINEYDWQMMAEFLAAQFSYHGSQLPSNTDDQGVPIMLYRSSDLPSMIHKIADSMTNMIRTSLDSTPVPGQSFHEETFINIQWAWISLPVLVVLSSNILLAVMMIQTWRRQAPVWKSSVLALMLHGLKSDSSMVGNAPTGLLSEMEMLAEQKSVRLNGHSAQDLKFVGV
jgi:hypothetical protein